MGRCKYPNLWDVAPQSLYWTPIYMYYIYIITWHMEDLLAFWGGLRSDSPAETSWSVLQEDNTGIGNNNNNKKKENDIYIYINI